MFGLLGCYFICLSCLVWFVRVVYVCVCIVARLCVCVFMYFLGMPLVWLLNYMIVCLLACLFVRFWLYVFVHIYRGTDFCAFVGLHT